MLKNRAEFKFKTIPYGHQERDFERSKNMKYFGLFWEMGCGKSKTLLDNIQYLFMNQEIDGALIIAPKGNYMNWITDEIPIHMHDYIPRRVAYWNSDANRMERKIAEALLYPQDDVLDILVMNTEALSTERAVLFAEQFIQSHHMLMAIDESTSIKNHKAKKTKAAWHLGKQCEYRRIMTGTPMTQGPLDVYAQCEFLQEGSLGFDSFMLFKCRYASFKLMTMGSRSFEKILGYMNLAELSEKLRVFTSRVLKSECLDLPDKVFINRYVEQTSEQEAAYKALKEEAVMMFENDEDMVTSTSVLTTMGKLHQINCGHVKTDEGNVMDIPNNRIPSLIEALEETPGKVIIWCHFIRDVELIAAAIKEHFGEDASLYYGHADKDQRAESIHNFRKGNSRFFVVTDKTGSKGLTLVESHQAIYYSYDYNLENWLQSQDRNHRIGQTKTVTYQILITRGTVDEKIIKSHKRKKHLADEVLDSWRELLD